MISYELAKRLKDAGFPQHGQWGYADLPEKITYSNTGTKYLRRARIERFPWHRVNGFSKTDYYFCLAPSLSELIDACGDTRLDEMFALTFNKNHESWYASYSDYEHVVQSKIIGAGSIPEEAVAKLWLAINEHGNPVTA